MNIINGKEIHDGCQEFHADALDASNCSICQHPSAYHAFSSNTDIVETLSPKKIKTTITINVDEDEDDEVDIENEREIEEIDEVDALDEDENDDDNFVPDEEDEGEVIEDEGEYLGVDGVDIEELVHGESSEALETSFVGEPEGSPDGKSALAPYEPDEEFPDEIFDDFLLNVFDVKPKEFPNRSQRNPQTMLNEVLSIIDQALKENVSHTKMITMLQCKEIS